VHAIGAAKRAQKRRQNVDSESSDSDAPRSARSTSWSAICRHSARAQSWLFKAIAAAARHGFAVLVSSPGAFDWGDPEPIPHWRSRDRVAGPALRLVRGGRSRRRSSKP
jgi:hypothetical protein